MSKLAAKDIMKGDPSSHRYINVWDKIGFMVKEGIRLDQMIETGVMVQTAIQDRIMGVIDSEEILEETAGRVVEKVTEVKGMVTTTIKIETD